jgi:hypothetical protein
LVATAEDEWVAIDHQGADALLDQGSEGGINPIIGAQLQHDPSQPQRIRGGVYVVDARLGIGIARVYEEPMIATCGTNSCKS